MQQFRQNSRMCQTDVWTDGPTEFPHKYRGDSYLLPSWAGSLNIQFCSVRCCCCCFCCFWCKLNDAEIIIYALLKTFLNTVLDAIQLGLLVTSDSGKWCFHHCPCAWQTVYKIIQLWMDLEYTFGVDRVRAKDETIIFLSSSISGCVFYLRQRGCLHLCFSVY